MKLFFIGTTIYNSKELGQKFHIKGSSIPDVDWPEVDVHNLIDVLKVARPAVPGERPYGGINNEVRLGRVDALRQREAMTQSMISEMCADGGDSQGQSENGQADGTATTGRATPETARQSVANRGTVPVAPVAPPADGGPRAKKKNLFGKPK